MATAAETAAALRQDIAQSVQHADDNHKIALQAAAVCMRFVFLSFFLFCLHLTIIFLVLSLSHIFADALFSGG